MNSVSGTYELVKNENIYEYLIEYGIPEDKAKLFNLAKIKLKVEDNGDTVTFFNNFHPKPLVLIMGKEVDEYMPLQEVLKSTGTREGNVITINSTYPSGRKGIRIYDFQGDKLVCTISISNSKIVARRTYARIISD